MQVSYKHTIPVTYRPVPEAASGKLLELYAVLKELISDQDSQNQDSRNQDSKNQDSKNQDSKNQDSRGEDVLQDSHCRGQDRWCFILSQTLSTIVGVASEGEEEVGVVMSLENVIDLLK